MNILTLNIGSGSQRCSLFQVEGELPDEPPEPVWKTSIESTFPGQKTNERLFKSSRSGVSELSRTVPADISLEGRIETMISELWTGANPLLSGPSAIDLVGHRVVHGGVEFRHAVKVDAQVEAAIERFAVFAPLHNRSNLQGIRTARTIVGDRIPQVAVFDTSFHLSLPEAAAVYPGPYEWLAQGIRRYGFHGTSFCWAAHRAARLLKRVDDSKLRLIICHLGGGCSLAATVGGKSVDTTMGFTPLDGIAMCTRSGALDPGILLFLARQNVGIDELEKLLNERSGLKGLLGLAGDTRVILPEAEKGNERARLAMDVFIHRLRGGIGQMLASLGDLPDALVFTDAISEDESRIRAWACEPFGFLGLKIDPDRNRRSPLDADIGCPDSRVRVLLIKSREDWEIARQCHAIRQGASEMECGA